METTEMLAAPFIAVVLVIAFVVPAVADPEWTPDQKEIIAVMDAWQKARDSGDADGLGRLLADEVNMTSRTLGGNFTDKARFLEAYRKWSTGSRSQPGSLTQYVTYKDVKVSGDEASVTRHIDWTRVGGRGGSGTSIKSARLRKIGGEWKIISEK